ncbi:MAG: bifunctional demethylmenaquinone methyltransferase/2-methoxy-6-polyprenyl-1,4-benzoquinol methylase UbiE [Pseudomonadota bacterium]
MSSERTTAPEDMQTAFGFETVAPGEKQGKVDQVFHSVAKRYDIMNDFMSMGIHRVWKDALVTKAAPSRRGEWRGLDVAGGTGDIAFRLVDASHNNAHVTVLDINGSMLDVGRERAAKKRMMENLDFVEASAEELPFEANTFDAYTIALGIRNVPDIPKALREAYRVLKPGGQILVLEFSDCDVPLFDRVYDAWSFNAIPRIGKAVTGDGDSYQYLVESIRKFPDQKRFAQIIRDAGFDRVDYRNMTGGITALHTGWKL